MRLSLSPVLCVWNLLYSFSGYTSRHSIAQFYTQELRICLVKFSCRGEYTVPWLRKFIGYFISDSENPHVVLQKPLRVIFGGDYGAEANIGPYFFENKGGEIYHTITTMIFLYQALHVIKMNHVWF